MFCVLIMYLPFHVSVVYLRELTAISTIKKCRCSPGTLLDNKELCELEAKLNIMQGTYIAILFYPTGSDGHDACIKGMQVFHILQKQCVQENNEVCELYIINFFVTK